VLSPTANRFDNPDLLKEVKLQDRKEIAKESHRKRQFDRDLETREGSENISGELQRKEQQENKFSKTKIGHRIKWSLGKQSIRI
jgi:hypothetical protein